MARRDRLGRFARNSGDNHSDGGSGSAVPPSDSNEGGEGPPTENIHRGDLDETLPGGEGQGPGEDAGIREIDNAEARFQKSKIAIAAVIIGMVLMVIALAGLKREVRVVPGPTMTASPVIITASPIPGPTVTQTTKETTIIQRPGDKTTVIVISPSPFPSPYPSPCRQAPPLIGPCR